jgi:hypothetical protein
MGETRQFVESTNITSNVPEYLRPYLESALKRTEAESYRPYIPYGYTQDAQGNVVRATDANGNPVDANRIAGFTPAQLQVQQNTLGMGSPNQFGMGSALAYQAGLGALDQSVFGNAEAQQYMSPYIKQALEPQMREAVFSAKRGQLTEDLGSARQGTYGGSRQLLASMERERNLGQQMGDIQARGMQSAYENAQQQFERDRQARFAGYQTAGQLGQTLGNLGQYQQNADIQRLQAQGAAAGQQQQMQQQYYDQRYADFLRQRDYPMEQLGYLNNMIRGLPMQLNSSQTTYGPRPSAGNQILGAGLGALGVAKTFG